MLIHQYCSNQRLAVPNLIAVAPEKLRA